MQQKNIKKTKTNKQIKNKQKNTHKHNAGGGEHPPKKRRKKQQKQKTHKRRTYIYI